MVRKWIGMNLSSTRRRKKVTSSGRNKGEIHEECNERKGCPMFDRLFMLILGLL